MDSRFPAPEAHNIVNGVKNAACLYIYLAAAAFAVALMMGWIHD